MPVGKIVKSPYDVGGTVKAVHIYGYPDMFREINNGFIVKQLHNGSLVAVYVKSDNGTICELSSKEKDIAHKMGFSVIK